MNGTKHRMIKYNVVALLVLVFSLSAASVFALDCSAAMSDAENEKHESAIFMEDAVCYSSHSASLDGTKITLTLSSPIADVSKVSVTINQTTLESSEYSVLNADTTTPEIILNSAPEINCQSVITVSTGESEDISLTFEDAHIWSDEYEIARFDHSRKCSVEGCDKTAEAERHTFTYTTSGTTITQHCLCGLEANATITLDPEVPQPFRYSGSPIRPLIYTIDESWGGLTRPSLNYENSYGPGEARGYLTMDDVSVEIRYTILKKTTRPPYTFNLKAETILGKCDGAISNVDPTMEYRLDGESTYTPVPDDDTPYVLSDLAAGVYYIRYKENIYSEASPEVRVEIKAGEPIRLVIPTGIGFRIEANKESYAYGESATLQFIYEAGYAAGDSFKIKLNDKELVLDADGCVSFDVYPDAKQITVEGVEVHKIKITYIVDGETLQVDKYDYGQSVTMPTVPEKEGYRASWDKSVTRATEDVTVTAVYRQEGAKIAITYVVDGKTLRVDEYDENATVTMPTVPAKEGYDGKWDKSVTKATEDITVTAIYTTKKVKITYIVDNSTMKVDEYTYGQSVTMPTVPEKEGYDGEWDKSVTKATEDITVTAVYRQKEGSAKYVITFVVDGKTLLVTEYDSNAAVTMPAVPEKEGYNGAWDVNVSEATGDLVINAVYTAKKITLTYVANGQTHMVQTYAYGESVTMPDVPEVQGMANGSWDQQITVAKVSATITAIYEIPTAKPTAQGNGCLVASLLILLMLLVAIYVLYRTNNKSKKRKNTKKTHTR